MLITIQELNRLWAAYWAEEDIPFNGRADANHVKYHTVIRFGQYVFNKSGFETDCSYNINDPKLAFNNLAAFIKATW